MYVITLGNWTFGKPNERAQVLDQHVSRVVQIHRTDNEQRSYGLVLSWMRPSITIIDHCSHVLAHSQALCAWLLEEDRAGIGKTNQVRYVTLRLWLKFQLKPRSARATPKERGVMGLTVDCSNR
jgi:hypothetical protein